PLAATAYGDDSFSREEHYCTREHGQACDRCLLISWHRLQPVRICFRRGGVNPRPSARSAESSCSSSPIAAIPAATDVRFSRFQAHAALSRAQSSTLE